MFLDFLGLLPVQSRKVAISLILCPEHFIKLRMDSMSVTALRALDKQRHNPSRHSSGTVPTERLESLPRLFDPVA